MICVLGCLLLLLRSAAGGVVVLSGNIAGKPTWARPAANGPNPPNSLGFAGSNVPFGTFTIGVTVADTYTFTAVTAPIWDIYAFLYQNAFNPAAPLSNVLIGDNDSPFSGPPTGATTFSLPLTPGTYVVVITTRRNTDTPSAFTLAISAPSGTVGLISSSFGDPHLSGANGVKFDFAGEPNGAYSLFSSPVFAVNMLLSPFGPETRFMTEIGVVYRGAAIAFDTRALVSRRDELTKRFESLGANVTFDGRWKMSVEFCADHVVSFSSMHTNNRYNGTAINYFDVAVSVPGCHDSFDGALGQTYQCRYVLNRTPFGEWTREREERFRVANLTAPSGSYNVEADCAHEDEFRDKSSLLGGMSA